MLIMSFSWDHPREYGENKAVKTPKWAEWGSSPRIRGKCCGVRCSRGAVGIIPANTGKIFKAKSDHRPAQDHPREYGENHRWFLPTSRTWGSSPRIRGKSPHLQALHSLGGIIPANTGKMPIVCGEPSHLGDHPREYGENTPASPAAVTISGSSPRIRGK